MKFLTFNNITIRNAIKNNNIFINCKDVKDALDFQLSMARKDCKLEKINKSVYVELNDLLLRLKATTISDYKVRTLSLHDYLIEIFPPVQPPIMPVQENLPVPSDKQLIVNYLSLALELLNQNCEKCSVNYDTYVYPCDQCIINPNFISHFKSSEETNNV